jgi:hypothetical protein
MILSKDVEAFVRESNAIEKIFRDSTHEEIDEFIRFVSLDIVKIKDLEQFVSIYQPGAHLRTGPFDNVYIGGKLAPVGGPEIDIELEYLLVTHDNAHHLHTVYERLHPFTDCNGRSGRALWAWRNGSIKDGFLLSYYYQTLGVHPENLYPENTFDF